MLNQFFVSSRLFNIFFKKKVLMYISTFGSVYCVVWFFSPHSVYLCMIFFMCVILMVVVNDGDGIY